MTRTISRVEKLSGRVRAPSSKSLTNRALILALAVDGPVTIETPLDCDDSRYMVEAIRKIGFDVSGSLRDEITIGDRISMYSNDLELFVGNAGTAMRFLCGTLPFLPGRYLLSGEARMHQRPIGHLVDALLGIGAQVDYVEREGFPPLSIRGRKMRGGFTVEVDGSMSSQFISALMMGGVHLPGGLTVASRDPVSAPYVELTAAIMEAFGFPVSRSTDSWRSSPANVSLDRYRVEGDFSAASYWFAAAAATRGVIEVEGISSASLQGDRGFLDVLSQMGIEIEWIGERVVRVDGRNGFEGGDFDFRMMPDVAPTLAAIAPLARTEIAIGNVGNLRIKESDRLSVLGAELSKLGASVAVGDDFIRIEPGWSDDPVIIDPAGDHRIAMSFAIAGLARGNVSIGDAEVVTKSYPGFWRALDTLVAPAD